MNIRFSIVVTDYYVLRRVFYQIARSQASMFTQIQTLRNNLNLQRYNFSLALSMSLAVNRYGKAI